MLQAVERWKAEINQMIMANMQAAMSQADGYVERLEQEIMELQRRDAELRQILETEDNIHFLQVLKDLSKRFAFAVGQIILPFYVAIPCDIKENQEVLLINFFCFYFLLNRTFPPCVFLLRQWCPKCSSTLSSLSAR